jgi:uncharacterized membrane protein (UPF0182 family)
MATRGSGWSNSGWSDGFAAFAGMMLILVGSFHVIAGIAAIAKSDYFVVGADYLYELDVTAWGWLHLILGIIVLFAGFGIFKEATWARIVGIGIAAVSAIGNFFFIPYEPVWALLIIALDVLVIASLAVRPPTPTTPGMGP